MSVDISKLGPEEQEILNISEAWSRSIVANDADAIGRFMADDWIMISERGIATKEHFLSFVRSGQLTHDSMDLAELARITIYGDTAVMAARITNVAHFAGQRFDANEWTSDVFRRTPDGWKCIATHITPAATIPVS